MDRARLSVRWCSTVGLSDNLIENGAFNFLICSSTNLQPDYGFPYSQTLAIYILQHQSLTDIFIFPLSVLVQYDQIRMLLHMSPWLANAPCHSELSDLKMVRRLPVRRTGGPTFRSRSRARDCGLSSADKVSVATVFFGGRPRGLKPPAVARFLP